MAFVLSFYKPFVFPFLLQALQVITNALKLHGGDADLYYHQGNFYKDLNNMQQAKKVRAKTLWKEMMVYFKLGRNMREILFCK